MAVVGVHGLDVEQAHEIAGELAALIRSGDALPVLRLEYFPYVGSRVVEASYLDLNRGHHTMIRLSLGGQEKIEASELPEALILNACLEAGVSRVLMDLSRLGLIGSRGLGILVSLYMKVSQSGGKMALVVTEPRVLDMLGATHLDRVLDVFGAEDTALDELLAADR